MDPTQILLTVVGLLITVAIFLSKRIKSADDERIKAIERRVDDLSERLEKQSSEFRHDFAKLEQKLDRLLDMLIDMKGSNK